MQKIITDGSKFFIKSYDEAGNSTGISVAYDTEADAQAALAGVEVSSPDVAPEAPAEVTATEQVPVEEDKKKEEEVPSETPSETSTETPSVESAPETGENKPEETTTE
jgi:hypothetical protein